jgi:ubiquinone biosynthesis protein
MVISKESVNRLSNQTQTFSYQNHYKQPNIPLTLKRGSLMHLRKDIRDIGRFEHILGVFLEEGLGYFLAKADLKSHLPFLKRIKPHFPINDKTEQAIRLRKSFEKLGPTFVKLGQLLSLRPDLVPIEYSQEFAKLQDHVPSFPYAQVKSIIEEDLKKPLSKVFKSFDKNPVASASIAQVHKAVLPSGKVVAVKVQRPEVKDIIDLDLDIMFFIAKELEKHVEALRSYRPTEVVKEFALWTRRELNFEIEAHNAVRLAEIMADNSRIKVPKVYHECSSKRILVMDFIEGVKIDNLEALKSFHISTKKISLIYFNSIMEQMLLHGFFHADPHPANIYVQKSGKLVFFDYGIMGELPLADRKKMVAFIESLPKKDPQRSVDIMLSLAKETRPESLAEFKRESLRIMSEVYNSTIQEKSPVRALYEVIILGTRYGVVFDPNHVLMVKSAYQAEGLALKLNPQFKISDGLMEFADKFVKQKYSPAKIYSEAKRIFWDNKDLLLELPEHIIKIMQRLERDEPAQQLNVAQLEEVEREWEYLSWKRNVGLIISALIIAAAVLFYLEGRKELWGIPLSVILLVCAVLLTVYFLVTRKNHEPEPIQEVEK